MARSSKAPRRAPPKRGAPFRGGGPGTVAFIMAPPPATKKEAPMAKRNGPPRRKASVGKHLQMSHSGVVGDTAVEVGCTAAELTFSLLSVAADYAAESTETTIDDKALMYGKPIVGTVGRVLAKRLAKKHPALCEVMRSGASAWNGDTMGQSWRRAGVKVQRKAAAKLAEGPKS